MPRRAPSDLWKFKNYTNRLRKVHHSMISRWNWVLTAFNITISSISRQKYEKWPKNGQIGPLHVPCSATPYLWEIKNCRKVLLKVHRNIISRWDGVLTPSKITIWSVFVKEIWKMTQNDQIGPPNAPCRAPTWSLAIQKPYNTIAKRPSKRNNSVNWSLTASKITIWERFL